MLEGDRFRGVMSRFAAGVTVVSTLDGEGHTTGFTATAFSSVSLEPPMVLCCVVTGSRSDRALSAGGGFAVSVLREDQAPLARRFADRNVRDRFEGVEVRAGELDLPLLEGAIASLTCRSAGSVLAGDHTIHLGEVLDGDCTDEQPLLHFRGAFASLQAETSPEIEPIADWMVGAAW